MRNNSYLIVMVALIFVALAIAVTAQAQTESALYSLTNTNGGAYTFGALTFDSAGNLYGTTSAGGHTANCPSGCGTLFELSPTSSGHWKRTVLHYFNGAPDGSSPASNLVFDAAGNLYGTSLLGGAANSCCGIVFKLTPSSSGVWKETILYAFTGGNDGRRPQSVTFDAVGNLYGAAQGGGNSSDCQSLGLGGCGLVFKLSPTSQGAWKQRVLYKFRGRGDGGAPSGQVVFDGAGNLYAITAYGGLGCGSFGCGVAIELTPTSSGPWKETTLYQFTGG